MENKTLETVQKDGDVFVVGRGFSLVGTVSGQGLCVIDGSIDGILETTDVKINSGGTVTGTIKCRRLDIDGHVDGTIEVQEIMLRSHANVDGKIAYATISMEAGAVVAGEMKCTRSAKPEPQQQENPNVLIAFSPETLDMIKGAKSILLELPNGKPIPDWIALKENGVLISRNKLQELEKSGQPLSLVLKFDGKMLVIDANLTAK